MLLQRLHEIIPDPHDEFSILNNNNQLYLFVQWAEDQEGNYCMYYEFPGRDGKRMNRKRVVIREFEALMTNMLVVNIQVFDRPMFQQHCFLTNGAGPCGFAVSKRMYEHLLEAARQRHPGEDLDDLDLLGEILG